jgi:hypothetical protein
MKDLADQAGLLAERQHVAEELTVRVLVTDPQPRDRRVIGRLIGNNATIIDGSCAARPQPSCP